jgi:hypothetical protein
MQRVIAILLGSTFGLALLTAGLWLWRNDRQTAELFAVQPHWAMVIAVKCAAVGLVAGGEALFCLLVVGVIWWRDRLINTLTLSATLVFLLFSSAAVAFAMVGR